MSHSFDAVVFDLDGVVTDTAKVHARAWKRLFDEYFERRAALGHGRFRAFRVETDYPAFIDGKPRFEGVVSFLASRRIELPYGNPSDDVDAETVCGLGNRKNATFTALLNSHGVEVFESTVALVRELAQIGIRRGVASSSKNCQAVLEVAGLAGLFEARVDGISAAELRLRGKPQADIFVECASRLGTTAHRTIIVEDAIAGVQAGRNGGFALVLGIDRAENADALKANGADVVVKDLAGVSTSDLDAWCRRRQQSTRSIESALI